MIRSGLLGAAACGVLVVLGTAPVGADEVPEKYRPAIHKGLEYLAKHQQKDGHWGAAGDQYPVSMTALAGMALLMEGSTVSQGKYAENIRRASDWLIDHTMKGGHRDGLIGNPDNATEASRYMYGHGFGLLFLACVYGEENDVDRRERLKDLLTRAVKYCANAQSTRGGWYYISRTEGGDLDEGSVTITQVQALRAARNAGIPVPRDAIKKAQDYLRLCTSPRGAVYYSWRQKSERPAITAAAIACGFGAGDYKGESVKKWLKFCQSNIPIGLGQAQGIRLGHDEYTHYYYAQCLYILGEKGWDKLFGPNQPDRMTWSSYRERMFDQLLRAQNGDGSWPSGAGFSVGPVYSTAIYCTIMQLDKGTLPIYMQ
jgi:hypothetical protein